MKKLSILLATGLLTLLPASASAAVLLPNLYAREYCSMRELGVTRDSALEAAAREAMISGDPVKVTLEDGSVLDADVLQAARAVNERCPEYLNE